MKRLLSLLVFCFLWFNPAKPQAILLKPKSIKLYVYFVTSRMKRNTDDSLYAYYGYSAVHIWNRRKLSAKEVLKKFGSSIFAEKDSDSLFVDAEYPFLDDLKENIPEQYKKIDSLLKQSAKYKTDSEMVKPHLTSVNNNEYRYSIRRMYAEWYEAVIDPALAAYILGSDLYKSTNKYDILHLFILKKEISSITL